MLQSRHPPSPAPQRFPRSQGYLDADEKRATAISGDIRKHHFPEALKINNVEWNLLIVITLLAFGIRLFRLSQPNSVVFDEVHFGKFASKYIMTQYFVDVHPPLAKLLITLVAFIRGYDGSFDFKEIGKVYPDNVPYTSMRMLPALLGVGVVPLAYLTLRQLRCGVTTALVGSLFILFENGFITQSRHILLDSPLVFFTALAVFCWVSFTNEDREHSHAFTEEWWLWLTLTGLSLGAVVTTIIQLWYLLGDLRVTPRMFIKHFLARALCLIVLPIFFYMAMFAIHFQILQSSGDGDGFMSAPFQHTLSGRGMSDTYADGGYLHSHDHAYPGGSHQQQITLYPHQDENNLWQITHPYEEESLQFIKNGDVVRLEHVTTKKRLHSHSLRPPVSDVDFQNEVSGYGFAGFSGDANDNWAVEIEYGDGRDRESGTRLRSLHTTFRLRHVLTGCYLFSHKVRLPEWGFEQQEVTCNTNAVKPNSLWFIETSTHPQCELRIPGFFAKFWELQQVMWTTNAGLTDKHVYDSRPYSWPFLQRGINFWVKDHRHIYLLGNPFVWWLSTSSVAVYAVARVVLVLRQKRGFQDFTNSRINKYDSLCGFLAIGWALHYLPFYLMQRQLFLHHYFPSLYFAIMLTAALFDFFFGTLRSRVRLQVGLVLILLVMYNFFHFSSLIYGNVWTRGQCESAKWIKDWDFSW
ncbi:glycosyltransferase family 39 protein [Cantharellus anzutake]|uniref:glycosyltransferase family 39 protein n=1 Tax=Cantharellus anzutake TaxID=1750568 RepID=UPI001904EEAA|nr:glycosyltransferase family 39 protein [Cantharellus anzutake]KAF8334982.1 glycosyltransferase family 39 protein [Cantharellus anzutake]